MEYDAVINDIEREFFNHETRGNLLLGSINKILDPSFHQAVSRLFIYNLDTLSKASTQSYLATPLHSLEGKRNEITELLNMAVVQQRNLLFGSGRLKKANDLARELIKEFTQAYDLD
jgi:hypothetical protein